jgi:RNA polymerase II subunit A small phosphatase-like protein
MKPLLILDLDGTLIFSSTEYKSCSKLCTLTLYPATIYHVYKRPYLDYFLDFCSNHFQIAIWTAASHSYATEIVRNLNVVPVFCYTSDKCTTRRCTFGNEYCIWDDQYLNEYRVKNLKKLWRKYDKNRVLIVDDTPSTYCNNYGNAIPIQSFDGNPDDYCLLKLTQYLSNFINVYAERSWRTVEKRYWLSEVS